MQKKLISQYATMLAVGIIVGLVAAAASYRTDTASSLDPSTDQRNPTNHETSIATKLDECDGACCGNLSAKELMLRQPKADKE